jgi:hypothetical protein
MAQYPVRTQKDSAKYVSATLPNAANTVNSNGIDLEATTPYPTTVTVRVSILGGTGANNKNINIRLQDSIDDVTGNYANIALLANPVLRSLDQNNSTHAAANVNVVLQPSGRRWVRAVALGEANGGDSSDSTFTLELLF